MQLTLDQRLKEAGYGSLSKFAEDSGISLRTLQDLRKRGFEPPKSISQIASFLQIAPDRLYAFDDDSSVARAVEALFDENPNILSLLAESRRHEENGDDATAEQLSEAAYQLDVSSISAIFRCAELAYKKQNHLRALELYCYGLFQETTANEEAVLAQTDAFLDCCRKTGNRKAANKFHVLCQECFQDWNLYAKLATYYSSIDDKDAMAECLEEAQEAKKAQ